MDSPIPFPAENLTTVDSPNPFPSENLANITTREAKHHVVMLPFMAQGHIIPLLELAKLLAKRTGFAITIASTPLNIRSLRPKIESAGPALDIRLAELPFSSDAHGLPPHTENTDSLPYHLFLRLYEASEHLEPHFERLIRHITQEDGGRLPLCIISDMFLGWTLDVGNRLGIPRIQFCTVHHQRLAACYTGSISTPPIFKKGHGIRSLDLVPQSPNISQFA